LWGGLSWDDRRYRDDWHFSGAEYCQEKLKRWSLAARQRFAKNSLISTLDRS
jgi:hypothetical protein